MMEKPLVSVAIIAYNVEKYIEQAIKSVLSQKVSFQYEIVIGEDCSTDNTRNIISEYQVKYPTIVKLLLHETNIGLAPNSRSTQNACIGKYVALLDGDDYWTSNKKLENQVLFLEKNPSYSGCAHQSQVIFEGVQGVNREFGSTYNQDYRLMDNLQHRKFHTSSLVYRRSIWMEFGGIPKSISSNERAIYPMIASRGPIRYLSDNMCVYRRNGGGLSARLIYKELLHDLDMIPWLSKFIPNFPSSRLKSFIYLTVFTYPATIPKNQLIWNYMLFATYSFSYFPFNLGDLKYGTQEFFLKLFKC